MLVSDGAGEIGLTARLRIAHLMRRLRVSLYWIYIRSAYGPVIFDSDDSPGGATGATGAADAGTVEMTPERALHDFFSRMGASYLGLHRREPGGAGAGDRRREPPAEPPGALSGDHRPARLVGRLPRGGAGGALAAGRGRGSWSVPRGRPAAPGSCASSPRLRDEAPGALLMVVREGEGVRAGHAAGANASAAAPGQEGGRLRFDHAGPGPARRHGRWLLYALVPVLAVLAVDLYGLLDQVRVNAMLDRGELAPVAERDTARGRLAHALPAARGRAARRGARRVRRRRHRMRSRSCEPYSASISRTSTWSGRWRWNARTKSSPRCRWSNSRSRTTARSSPATRITGMPATTSHGRLEMLPDVGRGRLRGRGQPGTQPAGAAGGPILRGPSMSMSSGESCRRGRLRGRGHSGTQSAGAAGNPILREPPMSMNLGERHQRGRLRGQERPGTPPARVPRVTCSLGGLP